MFWYVVNIHKNGHFGPDTDPDDLRIFDDRGMARVAMKIGLRVRVFAKPI